MSDEANRTELPPDRVTALWRRLKDHRVAQWMVGYVALAYAIQHGVTLTSEAFKWPDAVIRISMLLLILGMPFAVTFAWYQGERASRNYSQAELSILSVLLAVGALLFYEFVQPFHESPVQAVQEAGVAAARSAAANPRNGIALAVLPFANLSDDKQQEYFSDGMTEEITSALAKIPDLSVVARTSAFQFKGQNRDVQAIGQQLHATHLIEGSVRKAGDRLRITAELVKSDTGVTVWTESYDRQLTDVFAIQEDIARSVANSLHMTLGLKPGARLVSNRLEDQETYNLFLRGRSQLRARDLKSVMGSTTLEQVVAKAPQFAPAWATLSESLRVRLIGIARNDAPYDRAEILARSEEAARKAIVLDPNLAAGYAALSRVLRGPGQWAESLDLVKKALALDPDDPEVLNDYRGNLVQQGMLKEALHVSEHLTAVDPYAWLYLRQTGEVQMANGQIDAGMQSLAAADAQVRLQNGIGGNPLVWLAMVRAQRGQLSGAADALMEYGETIQTAVNFGLAPRGGGFSVRNLQAAAQILHAAAAKEKLPSPLPTLNSELNFVYIYAGVPERMLEWPEADIATGDYRPLGDLWWPMPSAVRKTERFKALLKKAGLVDHWRKNGWADLCHPTTGDDFECS